MSTADHFHAALLDALTSGKGIQHILDVAYDILDNPLYIVDTSYKLLASTQNVQVDDPACKELIKNGYFSYDRVKQFIDEKHIEKVHKSSLPMYISSENAVHNRLVGNITVDGKIVGYLIALEYGKSFDDDDMDKIILVNKIVSSEMQKNKYYRNTKGYMYEQFIIDLLDGNKKERKYVEQRARHMDLQIKEYLFVLVVNSDLSNKANTPLNLIRDVLEYAVSGGKSIVFNDTIVMLISRSRKISSDSSELKNLEEFLVKNNIYGGLSRPFNSLADFKEYYIQASKAIEIGVHLDQKKGLYIYEDVAPYHLLQLCYFQSEIKSFCHASIFILMEHDKINGTNYMESLYSYLVNSKKQAISAQLLHIHRATMATRIEKIEEIMDVNLDNPDTIFHILQTFKILEYAEGLRFY